VTSVPYRDYFLLYVHYIYGAFSALTLLVGQQEGHLAHKKLSDFLVRLFCTPVSAVLGVTISICFHPPQVSPLACTHFTLYVCGCLCQIEGLEQDRVRLVSDRADLETTVTKLEKSLKDSTVERDDLLSQLDAEKVSTASVLLVTGFGICSARPLLSHVRKLFSTVHEIVAGKSLSECDIEP